MGEQCMTAGSGYFISLDKSMLEYGKIEILGLRPLSLDLLKILYTWAVCTDRLEVWWTQSFIGQARRPAPR